MRKRRRLANKMTIMVCAVLIAVSAFFYAPMDVNASSITGSGSTVTSSSGDYKTLELGGINIGTFSFDNTLEDDLYYIVSFDSISKVVSSKSVRLRDSFTKLIVGDASFIVDFYTVPSSGTGASTTFTSSGSYKVFGLGSDLKNVSAFAEGVAYVSSSSQTTCKFTPTFTFSNVSCQSISGASADALEDAYSQGYSTGFNEGFSAGNNMGYSDGYGSGYSNGFQEGQQSGYNDGFAAGKDSLVDESFYDVGYQAGYSEGYSEGYDEGHEVGYQLGLQAGETIGYEKGFDEGYQSFKDRIDGWGADTDDYPNLKYSFFDDELQLICDVFTSAPSTSYDSALLCYFDFDINPNHTYKFVVKTDGTSGGAHEALYSDYKLNFVIGSTVINAKNNVGKTFDFYIPGYNMGSSILFESFVYDCVYYGGLSEEDGFLKNSGQVYPTLKNCYIDIYDMGPSGDTQNHIANQTDKLTSGWDSSSGSSANSDLTSGLNEFETAENSLFATATTGMKNFTFFDIESVPAMLTAVTFITSIMGSWFEQAGGASGVGIVLSILFSVMLVSMVLGLYRLYQSAGHRAEARQRHAENMQRWKKGK